MSVTGSIPSQSRSIDLDDNSSSWSISAICVNWRNATLKPQQRVEKVERDGFQEVLPHIYRAIGSKHLPMREITLVHFDSHPDMLIPLEMPAEKVFSKKDLFECLSIENWIIPAVYAGHINHIIWIKPPWCAQLVDKTFKFFVGKCSRTGTIRTSCVESYFLSEGLFVNENELENKKELTFTVITLCPTNWDILSVDRTQMVEAEEERSTCNGKRKHETDSICVQSSVKKTHIEAANQKSNSSVIDMDKDTGLEDSANNLLRANANNDILLSQSPSETNPVSQPNGVSSKSNSGDKLDLASKSTNSLMIEASAGDIDSEKDTKVLKHPSQEQINKICEALDGQYYVLDIDLDFFSTKNPFKEMYGERQYEILKELYRFTRPKSGDLLAIDECVRKRTEQMSALKNVFMALQNDNECDIVHVRKDLICQLIADLKVSTPGDIDYTLLHEAGCTCDDTELPHHVSSQSQISSLIDCVQEFLSYLTTPTLITIARSSLDDYCPPDQVDRIQDGVIDILQDLYQKISLNLSYQENSDCEQAGTSKV